MLSLKQLQEEHKTWATHNFGPHSPERADDSLFGVVEEVGELSHAHLKKKQGIRGTPEELDAKGKDAVGDILIYLTDYCNNKGWDLQEIIEETWGEVKSRDWKKNPVNAASIASQSKP